ncbi:MAG TPA: VOC family protein [Burkholderiales bacterium]|nr:VOC family protein [Burkholderiales bacterium]
MQLSLPALALCSGSENIMEIDRIDHLVLTVRDIDNTCAFYAGTLGMKIVNFGAGRKALAFGSQKINLHQQGKEFEPKADCPKPGSGDFCLITSVPMQQVTAHLQAHGVALIEGPVKRTGAVGTLLSVYFRDPDLNLIEVSNYIGD